MSGQAGGPDEIVSGPEGVGGPKVKESGPKPLLLIGLGDYTQELALLAVLEAKVPDLRQLFDVQFVAPDEMSAYVTVGGKNYDKARQGIILIDDTKKYVVEPETKKVGETTIAEEEMPVNRVIRSKAAGNLPGMHIIYADPHRNNDLAMMAKGKTKLLSAYSVGPAQAATYDNSLHKQTSRFRALGDFIESKIAEGRFVPPAGGAAVATPG